MGCELAAPSQHATQQAPTPAAVSSLPRCGGPAGRQRHLVSSRHTARTQSGTTSLPQRCCAGGWPGHAAVWRAHPDIRQRAQQEAQELLQRRVAAGPGELVRLSEVEWGV